MLTHKIKAVFTLPKSKWTNKIKYDQINNSGSPLGPVPRTAYRGRISQGPGGHKERHCKGTWRARRTNRALSTQKDAKSAEHVWLHQKMNFIQFVLKLLSCFVVSNLFANFFGIFIWKDHNFPANLRGDWFWRSLVFSHKHVSYSAFLQFEEAFFRCGVLVWGECICIKIYYYSNETHAANMHISNMNICA